jgi:dihydropyrimidinase
MVCFIFIYTEGHGGMLDLVIRGGRVVTPWGVGQWDVAVAGEKIVAVAEPCTLQGEVGRILDASGKIVVPGGIEPHAHVASPVPGNPGARTQPPEPVSRAALFGGTTTLTDFAIQHPGLDIPQAIDERTATWRGQSYCDYAHHCMLVGDIPFHVIAQVREAIADGHATFKIFTTNIRPTERLPTVEQRRLVGMGHLSGVMEQAAKHGGMMFVHAEDDDIVQYMYKKLTVEARTEWYNIHEVHNNLSEDMAFRRVLRLAEWTGAAVYFVHVSAQEGLNAMREARGRGLPVYGETLHNYVSFNAEDYQRGPQYHTYPSLKSEADRLALWDGLLNGGISSMATDGSCTDFAMKVAGRTIHDVSGGHHGIETRMGITYTEGVVKRGMPLPQFVEITSTNAARIMGYYPRKGAIAPGSDADIVLIDPSIKKILSLHDLHLGDYSIWEGWEIEGWPVTTILRGKVMVENGQFYGSPTDGRFIPRKIDPLILRRPVC